MRRRLSSAFVMLSLFLAAVGANGLTPKAASAESLAITLSSSHPNQVMVKFYSMNRNVYWPAYDRSWVIKDYDRHTYNLSCQRGEKICYGAWVKNRPNGVYWGLGPNKNNGCQSCCWTCNGGQVNGPNLRP